MTQAGIYTITNKANARIYIGSSVDVYHRLYDHVYQLINKIHPNRQLQRSWNKYGESNFDIDILEFCEASQCLIREQHYFDTRLFAQEFIRKEDRRFIELSFNVNPVAGSCIGREISGETLNKISEGLKKYYTDNPSKIRIGSKHPMYGKVAYNKGLVGAVLEERRVKIVRINQDINDFQIFNKCEDLEASGYSRTPVRRCCQGKQPIYRDCFWMYYSDFLNDEFTVNFIENAINRINKYGKFAKIKGFEIIKKDADGNVIQIFDPFTLDPKIRRSYNLACSQTNSRKTNKYKGYYYSYGKQIH